MLFALFVFPGILGAVVTAQSGSSLGGSGYTAFGWGDARDSSGVPVSYYMFVTDTGGILSPWNTAMAMVLSLQFAGWREIIGFGDWISGTAVSLSWADRVGAIFVGVTENMLGQLPLWAMFLAGTTIGSLFVGIFVVTGKPAKAAMQTVFMFGVGLGGVLVMAFPLHEAVAGDGPFGQGRDLGVALGAAALGNNDPDPAAMTKALQSGSADRTRKLLQKWNYGHVVDKQPLCKIAFTNGTLNQSEKQIKEGLTNCGDTTARHAADNPNAGQIGVGFVLFIVSLPMAWFGIKFSFGVFMAWADGIYNGMVLVFWDLPMGGFIYGDTQLALIRRIVNIFMAFVRMVANIFILAVYTAVCGSLLEESDDDVLLIVMLVVIVMIVGIVQSKRMNDRFNATSDAVANRIGQSIASGGIFAAPGGGGGGGGGGMGLVGLGNSMHSSPGHTLLSALGAVSVIGSSPLTAWMLGGRRNPLLPYAGLQRRADLSAMERETVDGLGGAHGWSAQASADRSMHTVVARQAMENAPGGPNTARGAAAILTALNDAGLPRDHVGGAFHSLEEWKDMETMMYAQKAAGRVTDDADPNPGANPHMAKVVAALALAQDSAAELRDYGPAVQPVKKVAADYSALQQMSYEMHRPYRENRSMTRLSQSEQDLVNRFIDPDDPIRSRRTMRHLQRIADGEDPIAMHSAPNSGGVAPELHSLSSISALRMMHAISESEANAVRDTVDAAVWTPTDPHLLRVAREKIWAAVSTSHWQHDIPTTAHNTPTRPDFVNNPGARSYGPGMDVVQDLLRERR
ncbi:hypothetical protein [Nocardia altamirensis]|uniref:hypothetical protein n=1 Tax=Nocardia altamirensis TaxID=472158 RepID=UPI00114D10EE|nr:hypothetical protein [Nocardia altamirensis]